MQIKTALILCAGFGKRLLPLTNSTPKPLLEINKKKLLDNAINFVFQIGIKKIKINTFHLSGQIEDFIKTINYSANIEIINDGKDILDTGGGILNLIKNTNEDDFLCLNPDTIWSVKDKNTIDKMQSFYFHNKITNLLMVVNRDKSFDARFKGDFTFEKNQLSKLIKNDYIYTGCQIFNKKIFNKINKKIFSISEIWNDLLDKNELYGYESLNEFVHLTDIEIYNKLNN
jgi:MurNAc alpha-1-phosphate uridylyltransferase